MVYYNDIVYHMVYHMIFAIICLGHVWAYDEGMCWSMSGYKKKQVQREKTIAKGPGSRQVLWDSPPLGPLQQKRMPTFVRDTKAFIARAPEHARS